MKKRNSYAVPTLYLLSLFLITIGVYYTTNSYNNYKNLQTDEVRYVSNSIFSRNIPIINITEIIRRPFSVEDIEIKRYYYNHDDDIEKKEKSVVFYEGTYMPNTGIDYVYKDIFDILSIYDGTVVDVLEDELLGKTVKIKHNKDIISVYQGLSSIDVKKGDLVFVNQKIGTSGTNKINESLGNHLHFEIYKDGKTIDPSICYDKNISDI